MDPYGHIRHILEENIVTLTPQSGDKPWSYQLVCGIIYRPRPPLDAHSGASSDNNYCAGGVSGMQCSTVSGCEFGLLESLLHIK